MKARLLIAAIAFFAISSLAVAQDQTKSSGCCKAKTECSKAKEGVKPENCDKSKTTEKAPDKKTETSKKVVVVKKQK